MSKTYTYHQDPGHGWIEVPMRELRDLGIAGRITPWSYREGETAYLEEDNDASLFLDTMRAHDIAVELIRRHRDNSPIRHYHDYWAD